MTTITTMGKIKVDNNYERFSKTLRYDWRRLPAAADNFFLSYTISLALAPLYVDELP
jgi:hypothetical protein